MSRCRSLSVGILAALVFAAATAVNGAQYSSNMFLNGDYQNGLQYHPDEEFRSNSAAAFISMLSKRATPFVGEMYLPTLLECRGRQQCVPKDKCVNGFFTQQLPKIQMCAPEDNVCCTYNPPTPAPTTTTTQTPYSTCSTNMACVAQRDCRNGEILSNAVVNLENKKCTKPNVCCGVPSTMLTQDGYVLKTPPTPLTYPSPEPFKPTTPVSNNYLPPSPATPPPRRPQPPPQRPTYTNEVTPKPQPTPTPAKYLPPAPPQPQRTTTQAPVRQPQPTQPKYPQRPTTTQSPFRQPIQQYTPAPTPSRRIPSTSPPKYLPPTRGDNFVGQPSVPKPLRGEDQLSPQIFPPAPKNNNRPTQPRQPFEPAGITPSKCASALVCTDENYCSSIGVISETPVEISPFRVPLTDCFIEGSGAAGKCCRDSNYVDPWPVNLAGVCAQKNKNTKPRGVKDIDSNFAEIPWQAMILKESSKSLLCGGAIIGDGVVLTTAGCTQGVSVNDLRVKAGEWELGSTNEPLNFQLVGVKSVEIHPLYDASTGSNDMAVVHLADRLQFASHIQPICISDKDPSPSETCVTTGWGKQALSIHEEGAVMHVTTTTPESRSDCGADSSGVCSSTKYDSCQFDAGSALACGSGTSVLLKGIYSVENACGEGQTVRFSKPDVAWVNKQFLERSKPLLLRV